MNKYPEFGSLFLYGTVLIDVDKNVLRPVSVTKLRKVLSEARDVDTQLIHLLVSRCNYSFDFFHRTGMYCIQESKMTPSRTYFDKLCVHLFTTNINWNGLSFETNGLNNHFPSSM